MTRQVNAAGIALIQGFETDQPVGMLPTSRDVPTAGWGHTGPDVKLGVAYPLAQRQTWFAQDLKWACDTVEEHCTVPLTDNQFAALVSICFNIGAANFDRSTLLKDLNASDTTDAAAQFLVWDKQRGVKLAGLDRRRAAEKALFETP